MFSCLKYLLWAIWCKWIPCLFNDLFPNIICLFKKLFFLMCLPRVYFALRKLLLVICITDFIVFNDCVYKCFIPNFTFLFDQVMFYNVLHLILLVLVRLIARYLFNRFKKVWMRYLFSFNFLLSYWWDIKKWWFLNTNLAFCY